MTDNRLDLNLFMQDVATKNPSEPEFHQAVKEVAVSLIPFINKNPKYLESSILERLIEPDRMIVFRVCWEDDHGCIRINRGYRVQFNNSLGPYKGGLRFHPSVNLSVLKFLGFEQIFKNSLTTLPIGGAKGGANFDPKGKSDREVMRFCQSFMTELARHIDPDTDVPAGDIGVGAREIGYLFGQYKRIQNKFSGVLTGKGIDFGGSQIRKESTGYGCVYFAQEIVKTLNSSLQGKSAVISGSGNVAQYVAEKLLHLKGTVLAMSDSSGTLYDPDGIDQEKLEFIKELKNNRRERLSAYEKRYAKAVFYKGQRPWHLACDLAFPCATQNELELKDAKQLVKNNCMMVVEGANMPSTQAAIDYFKAHRVIFAPGKAANAGGVAISAMEMAQNSMKIQWSKEEIDHRLQLIMQKIYRKCVLYGREGKEINYVKGANIAGFVKVADTMLSLGVT